MERDELIASKWRELKFDFHKTEISSTVYRLIRFFKSFVYTINPLNAYKLSNVYAKCSITNMSGHGANERIRISLISFNIYFVGWMQLHHHREIHSVFEKKNLRGSKFWIPVTDLVHVQPSVMQASWRRLDVLMRRQSKKKWS